MEEGQFQKIQSWFERLDHKVENLVTKQHFENRYQALLSALTNLHQKLEGYKGQQGEEIAILKRAIHDIEEELKQLASRLELR